MSRVRKMIFSELSVRTNIFFFYKSTYLVKIVAEAIIYRYYRSEIYYRVILLIFTEMFYKFVLRKYFK